METEDWEDNHGHTLEFQRDTGHDTVENEIREALLIMEMYGVQVNWQDLEDFDDLMFEYQKVESNMPEGYVAFANGELGVWQIWKI